MKTKPNWADGGNETLVPLDFIDWKEAVSRLEEFQNKLKETLDKQTGYEFLPGWALWIAVNSQIRTLKKINTDYLNCCVPWDVSLGLPSLPTIEADAKKGRDWLEAGDKLGILLNSFCEWTLFFSESIFCACGTVGLRARKVNYDLLINNSLVRDEKTVLVKQFTCIRSSDKKHLVNHYSKYVGSDGKTTEKLQNPSKVLPDSIIPWVATNRISVGDTGVVLEKESLVFAKEFYDPYEKPNEFVFGKRFMEVIKSPVRQ